MNEEEKQAIEYWKTHIEILHCNTQIASEHYIKVLLDLVEKQQKEIERLKEFEKYYENGKVVWQRKDYISKDKIKEKMRGEINKSWRNTGQRKCQLYAYDILKELLGE